MIYLVGPCLPKMSPRSADQEPAARKPGAQPNDPRGLYAVVYTQGAPSITPAKGPPSQALARIFAAASREAFHTVVFAADKLSPVIFWTRVE